MIHLSKAVQLDPKMEAAYLNLAAVYMETQLDPEDKGAKEALREAGFLAN